MLIKRLIKKRKKVSFYVHCWWNFNINKKKKKVTFVPEYTTRLLNKSVSISGYLSIGSEQTSQSCRVTAVNIPAPHRLVSCGGLPHEASRRCAHPLAAAPSLSPPTFAPRAAARGHTCIKPGKSVRRAAWRHRGAAEGKKTKKNEAGARKPTRRLRGAVLLGPDGPDAVKVSGDRGTKPGMKERSGAERSGARRTDGRRSAQVRLINPLPH